MANYQPTPDAREPILADGKTGLVRTVWYRFFSDIRRQSEAAGQYLSSNVASGSAVTMSGSGTATNITSLELPEGVFDVTGCAAFSTGTAGATRLLVSVSETSATTSANPFTAGYNVISATFSAGDPTTIPLVPFRKTLTQTTTVYLVAAATYAGTAATAYGFIGARRVR